MAKAPRFAELTTIEEEALVGRLKALRKTITHAGEKGRSLEWEVTKILRLLLPAEYGLSTGFFAYWTPDGIKLSQQLDIIIYDALRGGPIARLGTCDVFPLESVYGYVEVKASLRSTSDNAEKYADDSIELLIQRNAELRQMRNRKFYVVLSGTITGGVVWLPQGELWTPIRGYVFAFEAQGTVANTPACMAKRMHEVIKKHGAHLHGVYVGESAFYLTRPSERDTPEDEWHHVLFRTDHLLSTLKWELLHSLSRFPRYPENCTPALDRYYETIQSWQRHPP